jgi:hypothetical protein
MRWRSIDSFSFNESKRTEAIERYLHEAMLEKEEQQEGG